MLNSSKFLLLFLVQFLLIGMNCYGQDSLNKSQNKNLIYFELIGNAPAISINYERMFWKSKSLSLNYRTGIGYYYLGFESDHVNFFSFPMELNSILFNKNHHLEAGFAITPFISKIRTWSNSWYYYDETLADNYSLYYLIFTEIGYRFQKPTGKWMFQASFTQMWYNSGDVFDTF